MSFPSVGDIGYFWDGASDIVRVRCVGRSGTWRDWETIETPYTKASRFRTNGCFRYGKQRVWIMPDPDRAAMFAVRCLSEKWHEDPLRLRGTIHTLCESAEYWRIHQPLEGTP